MGADAVNIGLNHTLPVDDPRVLAREIAQRLQWNIELGYDSWTKYDETRRLVLETPYTFVELERFIVDASKPLYRLSIPDYQYKLIREKIGKSNLKTMNYSSRHLKVEITSNGAPGSLYELEIKEPYDETIYIHKEHIELGVYQTARWFGWIRYFDSKEHWQLLLNYRLQVAERAKAFGCSQVIFFSDQGPSLNLYDIVELSNQEIMQFIQNRTYIHVAGGMSEREKDEWIKAGKIIQYQDYFEDKIHLKDGEFIDVIFDDFRGLDELIKTTLKG